MKRRSRREASPATAASYGAAAGLIGGLALTAVDRLVMPRLAGGAPRERRWDDAVAGALSRVGFRVSGRRRTAAGIATGLAYAALLGAGYGVARQILPASPAARGLLDAALIYGASMISPEPARVSRRRRRLSKREAMLRRVSPVFVFGQATTAAYKALSRRAG